jgi:glycosyltransferase involved in cell wall biosynthesis
MIHYMTVRGVSDAWVGNELRVVGASGIPFRLHALARSSQSYFGADDIARIARETNFLYPLPPVRTALDVLAAPFRFGSRFFQAFWNALTGERESFRNRLAGIVHFFVACHWAAQLRNEKVSHIHSQWIHSAGTVAMYGAWLLGRSFSFTGHAADLFRERTALRDKIRRADFIVCISDFHRRFYLDNGARPEQLFIAYCGIDPSHFSPRPRTRAEGEPFRILSSGRLVEKKGFHVLIDACAILRDRGLDFTCAIAGSGPLDAELHAQVRKAGLEGRVTLTGEALKQEAIPDFMEGGDVYCLPCVWASDNDVDGLPQMLMEAMACGLPAVSTDLVGIPDLVIDGKTGLLVPPEDATALADALQRMAGDPALAQRLAAAGRAHVLKEFDLGTCLEPLLDQYRKRLERRA